MSTARERTFEATGKTPSSEMGAVKIVVNGEGVIVDAATFTGKERQLMKGVLSKLGYEADGEDALFAAIWVTLRRSDPTIRFDDVLESVTLGALADAEQVDPIKEGDDSPEA